MISDNRRLTVALTLILSAGFIVYGSLYPFHFRVPPGPGAIAGLFADGPAQRQSLGNLLGNILFYMPFGLCAALSMGRRWPAAARISLISFAGLVLSLCMELTQHFEPGRVSTVSDIYPNVIGAFVGAACAGLALPYGSSVRNGWRAASPAAVLLLAAFAAYRLFPYVPSLDLHEYWRSIKPVLVHPRLGSASIARYLVMWLVVASLLEHAAGARRSALLLVPVVGLILAAKIAIVDNHISASEMVGAGAAIAVWALLVQGRARMRVLLVAALLTGLIIQWRLQSFAFSDDAMRSFGWWPFASMLHGSMSINTVSVVEKFFFYASLIWLLTRAGMAHVVATTLVTLLLFVTSLLETHLPHGSADTTDAALSLMSGIVLWLMERPDERLENSSDRPAPAGS